MKKFLVIVILSSIGFACYSDFDCGIGYKCVKAPFNTTRVCMKSVNQYGIQQFNMPTFNSMMPKTMGNCQFDMYCPIGFRCDPYYKECVR